MCGIAGIFNFNQYPIEHSRIKYMTDSISHRGPDGEGQYVDDYVALGHRRLAIIDLSSAGHQPMQTRDGRFTITYNGEVYNFKELRAQLELLGHVFYSNTDTEVVLYSYIEWGVKAIEKYNGMFSFAIWDKEEKKMFLARDRYGIKPLYYYITDKYFVFASEVKAIIASGFYQSRLDKEGLLEYLTFQNFFTDKTIFRDVKILMPGYYAYIDIFGAFKKNQYWDFNFFDSIKISEEEAVEEVDRLFKQAVRRQLISDVPVNAYLSGGIDSGAIAMIASKFIPHMKTFTIGFDLSSISGLELSFDERAKAEHVSYLAKTEHYEMVLKAGDMEKCMDRYIWHLEEPRVGQSYPNYYAAKLASKFGKVILSGASGDELFGGYPWRYFYTNQEKNFDEFIDSYYLKWQRLVSNSVLKKLLSPIWEDVKHVWTRNIFADVLDKIKKNNISASEDINYSLYFEAKTFLHGILIVEDKLSMAHGLETRVPFLDNDLVDFVTKLPNHLRISTEKLQVDENDIFRKSIVTEKGKIILRKALSKYLDDVVVNGKKQGFSSPDASWFRGDSIEYINKELNDPCSFFDPSTIKIILNQHVSQEKNNRLAIWSILYLQKILKSQFFG
ncbi:MAG: asparagine synthase (glutamine-hydrolyzing) [Coxiellaceae bacterium]|jgi:asparagine synthase (glutamine-hydrolysing)|nr:asparagine synthase (glutamine-hydrolyzing) [Coxiellaceae bacterium]